MAVATGNYIPAFTASQGNIAYVTSAPTYSGSSSISSIANILDLQVIQCKTMTVTPPNGEVNKIDLHGTESTTTGSGVPSTGVFQNAIFDELPWSPGTVSGTMILTLHNDGTAAKLPDFLDLATGTGQAISTTYHRHTFGDSTSGQARVLTGALLINYNNGVQEGLVLLNAPVVNWGDITPTGADGHWEVNFTATCLPKDFVIEAKDQD